MQRKAKTTRGAEKKSRRAFFVDIDAQLFEEINELVEWFSDKGGPGRRAVTEAGLRHELAKLRQRRERIIAPSGGHAQ